MPNKHQRQRVIARLSRRVEFYRVQHRADRIAVMQHPAWSLVIIGVLIAAIGAVWLFAPSVPWLGKLPRDIVIDRENFQFYFIGDDVHPAQPGADRNHVAGPVLFTVTGIRLVTLRKIVELSRTMSSDWSCDEPCC